MIYVVQNGSNWFWLDKTQSKLIKVRLVFFYFSMARPPSDSNSCINWNQYYTECEPLHENPYSGAISFDNIGLAWVAIFLVRFFSTYKQKSGVILTFTESSIFRMLSSIKNQKFIMFLASCIFGWPKKPVLYMKYWHGWLLTEKAFSCVFSN